MKRQLTSILLFSALLMGGASTFVSCTDHESDAAYVANGTIADELYKQAQKFETEKTNLQGQIEGLTQDLTTLRGRLEGMTGEGGNITIIYQNIQNIENNIKALQGKLQEAETAITEAKKAAETAKNDSKNYTDQEITALRGELAQAKTDLNNEISAVKILVNNNKTAIETLQTSLADLTEKVNANTQKLAEHDQMFEDLVYMLDDMQTNTTTKISNLQNMYDDLEARLTTDEAALEAVKNGQATLEQTVGLLQTKLDEKVDKTSFDAVKAAVDANKTDIDALKARITTVETELATKVSQSDFDVLNGKVSDLDAAYKAADQALESKITALQEEVNTKLNELFAAMANMVTGIELQATESPISGYENLSFLGAEAHILGTYYGTAAKMAKIGDETINAQDLLITENGENAGVVYATINPSNKDFSGLKLKVVDSQGNEAPFTATVTKSDRVLKYGINRASASNLYAIKINLDADKINDAKTWTSADAAELKDAAKQVLNKLKDRSNTLNLTDVATTVAKTFNNRLTAYGLQLEQEVTVNGKTETRNITSKLSLAATALRPLSYNFLENGININIKDIPTLEEKGIYVDTSSLKWTDLDHIADITQSVTVDVPDPASVTIDGKKVTISADGQLRWAEGSNKDNIDDISGVDVTVNGVTFGKGAVKWDTEKQVIKVTVSMKQFNDMIDQINSQVGNMIGSVNDLANKVNGYVETIDGSIINRVNNYIHKFNYYLDNANKFLQPAMFATDGTNWAKLPTIANGATYTKQGSSIVLVATSYTAELLAPAYKKYITVTSPSGQKVSGVRLNQVLDGDWHKVGFTASELGTYTINYQAVDYSGNVVSKNFYVKAVK